VALPRLHNRIVSGEPRRSGLSVTVHDARPNERMTLEDLQRRASLHATTYRDQLVAHPDAIELPAEHIDAGLVRVAECEGATVGFAVLLPTDQAGCELDGLFVEPEHWRAGVGRILIEDAAQIARRWGAMRIDVIANPDAIAFYLRIDVPGRWVGMIGADLTGAGLSRPSSATSGRPLCEARTFEAPT
jgi:GNAT superfamily N-acetyltransferase